MSNWFRRVLPALVCLALSGCFFQPGKFDSALDLHKDGSFTFTYKGQIYMLALSKLADMAGKTESGEFTPKPCQDDDFNDRKCTADELAKQKRDWQDEKAKKQQEDKNNAEAMRAMLGGIDPSDPEAAKELTDRLRHQAGWHTVNYMGDGLFEVDFSISSKLTHDFAFPVIEQFPMSNSFVEATVRADNTVRIDATGFTGQSAVNPMQGPMGSMLGAATLSDAAKSGDAGKSGDAAKQPPSLGVPDIDGTFRIVTDGEILANNTDQGPQAGTGGKVLQWRVTKRTTAAPMALVKLAP
jgi:hypothetical protein